jgi:tyrosinase
VTARSRKVRVRALALVLGVLSLSLVLPPMTEAGAAKVLVRKDVKDLTAAERRHFVEAVLKLKATPSPYDADLSYYDQFVAWHRELSRCDPADPLLTDMQMAHLGPMFLAWHREFVLLFEQALAKVSGKRVAVPYWNWTDPKSTRAVFSDGFMGGDGDAGEGWAVTTGPFRKGRWQLTVQPIGLQWASSATPYITRHFGSVPGVTLPTPTGVTIALQSPRYDVAPFNAESDPRVSFRNAVEGFRPPLAASIVCGPDGVIAEAARPPQELHNSVHIWVGGHVLPEGGEGRALGTMFNVTSSPNDPVFFLHHAMVDRLWAQWQERNGVDTYLPRSGYPKNNVDDVMQPFDDDGIRVAPRDVASIRGLGYRYDSLKRKHPRPRGGVELNDAQPSPFRFQCGVVRQRPA